MGTSGGRSRIIDLADQVLSRLPPAEAFPFWDRPFFGFGHISPEQLSAFRRASPKAAMVLEHWYFLISLWLLTTIDRLDVCLLTAARYVCRKRVRRTPDFEDLVHHRAHGGVLGADSGAPAVEEPEPEGGLELGDTSLPLRRSENPFSRDLARFSVDLFGSESDWAHMPTWDHWNHEDLCDRDRPPRERGTWHGRSRGRRFGFLLAAESEALALRAEAEELAEKENGDAWNTSGMGNGIDLQGSMPCLR